MTSLSCVSKQCKCIHILCKGLQRVARSRCAKSNHGFLKHRVVRNNLRCPLRRADQKDCLARLCFGLLLRRQRLRAPRLLQSRGRPWFALPLLAHLIIALRRGSTTHLLRLFLGRYKTRTHLPGPVYISSSNKSAADCSNPRSISR